MKRVLAGLLLVLGVFGFRAYWEWHSYRTARGHHQLATDAIHKGDWPAAEKHLEDCVAAYKYMPAAWEELATTKEVLIKYEESSEVLRESIVYLPKSQRLNLLYAISLVKIGDKEGAVAAATIAQQLDPGERQSEHIIRSPDKLIAMFAEKIKEEKERAANPSATPAPGATPAVHDHSHDGHDHGR